MGSCCDLFFHKQQYHANQSRLKLLQNKITISYSTQNDNKFTYYLHIHHQAEFLKKILTNFKQYTQRTQDNSQFQIHSEQVSQEYQKLNRYVRDLSDQNSQLQKTIKADLSKINKQCQINKSQWLNCQLACMIKLQIQDIQLVKGINRIGIIKQGPYYQNTNITEYFVVNRVARQKIYREFIFPSVKSRLKIVTDPIDSSITIDLEDVAKHQVFCGVFNFKNRQQQFGYIAIRLQYVTSSLEYRKQKMMNLGMIQKQLKLCLQGKDGLNRLSQYHSDTSSLRHTFISEEVSEYNNQYHA